MFETLMSNDAPSCANGDITMKTSPLKPHLGTALERYVSLVALGAFAAFVLALVG